MNWTTWKAHDLVFFAFMIVALLVVFRGHDRLRMKTPKVRLAIGSAGFCLSLFTFFAIMRLLPKPDTAGYSLVHDTALIASCSLFAAILILSSMQILGGAIQGFKRWRYYRRNVG